ncbi:hydroxyphenylacetyl-CoA thioesterase PaaI [Micrococcoides hystricis]|uniref:Hydroxyphenylacetyl-CoA thioesterase PaaI n=1 Tax=Micrococcoides hystricis TaxID=1572761 RepID=A0ABV6P987_9MICC
MMATDYVSHWMGVDVLAVRDGHATITMTVRKDMLNGFGTGQGGVVFAFADSAFALACNPAHETETVTVASGVDINFLAPAVLGRKLTAIANKRTQFGRSGIYDIQVLQETPEGSQELIAEFRGRSRTVPRPKN